VFAISVIEWLLNDHKQLLDEAFVMSRITKKVYTQYGSTWKSVPCKSPDNLQKVEPHSTRLLVRRWVAHVAFRNILWKGCIFEAESFAYLESMTLNYVFFQTIDSVVGNTFSRLLLILIGLKKKHTMSCSSITQNLWTGYLLQKHPQRCLHNTWMTLAIASRALFIYPKWS
jgi:hypothetical protein